MPTRSIVSGPGASELTRRGFIASGIGLAAASFLPQQVYALTASDAKISGYPFTLGIASGDPTPDGVILWTRLAPNPREPGGGMPPNPVEVDWQIAEDESFKVGVRRGTTIADPAWAHSVHLEVDGLQPDRWYWYQFRSGGEVSPVGRTRTLPAAEADAQRLCFAFASCQKYEIGYYTAYEHMVREDLDLVFFLGDYIYEKKDSRDAVRPHGLPTSYTLDDYRTRYAVYKTDTALQAAHAMAPWIVTWDDHEVSNDYAGAVQEIPEVEDPARFLRRRAAAYQAYYEHMPLRRSAMPAGPDMRLYRRLDFGRLARFNVLDTRQYRTDQPAGPRLQPAGAKLLDPDATMLGQDQLTWLFDGLDQSPANWNVLAQQVLMASVDRAAGPDVIVDVDKWSGYEFERRRLLRHLHEKNIINPVVLTGDIHSNWANELIDESDPAVPRNVAVEFVGTSISSNGHGYKQGDEVNALLAENPAVKFHNDDRGYVHCVVTPQEWKTNYRTIAYVNQPGAPLQTPATFVVKTGEPKLTRL